MPLKFPDQTSGAIPLQIVPAESVEVVLETLPAPQKAWAEHNGFTGKLGQVVCLPGNDGQIARVLAGWGDAAARRRGRHHLAGMATKLPEGDYVTDVRHLDPVDRRDAELSLLLSQYRFDRYRRGSACKGRIAAPPGTDVAPVEAIATGVELARDLINTPAADMGPDALDEAVRTLALEQKAEFAAIRGPALLVENLPLIHTVGRAAEREPRLLDLTWGRVEAPKITIVGKGVCFDTGGLNLKPGASMGLMKKDMGGAAAAIGLAHMVMSQGLDVRLRVLIPAVENAVSGNAMRPGDVLIARNGMTVEVNNTDAEGRLVLADALSMADDEEPDLIVSLATLTGAARVALGPDVPPFYTDDDGLADEIAAASAQVRDPVWRLPLWPAYEEMIEPGIADLDNAPAGGMAGSITAALFLRRFVSAAPYAHFDIYGWTPRSLPGRPKGGECQAARALFAMLESRYGRA